MGAYAAYPGLPLIVTALAAITAAAAIYVNRAWGWLLGIAVAALSWLPYAVQETVGLGELQQTWWEPPDC
jgi:hypothetical protein